jgi:hypothetical protein
LHTITRYLRNIGIKPKDRVVFIPEICVRSLYLMNQPGWVLSFASKTDTAQEQNDSISMADFVKSGADYLITNNMASIFNRKSILPYTRQLVAQQGNVYIFKIPPVRTNFVISENPAEIFHIQCDAENADSTGADLFFDDLNYKANMGGIRSEDPVRSGKFSVLMNESHVYAFTTMIHARPLDIIKVKVFCKGDNINCNVACGCDGYETRYDSEIRADTDSTGWKCLTGSITVPSYYDSDSFKIYIYNPAGTPVYLDDFEISVERYELNKL